MPHDLPTRSQTIICVHHAEHSYCLSAIHFHFSSPPLRPAILSRDAKKCPATTGPAERPSARRHLPSRRLIRPTMLSDSKLALNLQPPQDHKARVRAASVTMLRQSRRLLWRSRGLVYSALISIFFCSLLLSATSGGTYHIIPWTADYSSGPDYSGGLLKTPKGKKPKSKDYDDNLARFLFSKEWNETAVYVLPTRPI